MKNVITTPNGEKVRLTPKAIEKRAFKSFPVTYIWIDKLQGHYDINEEFRTGYIKALKDLK